jgi:hypothetical protein
MRRGAGLAVLLLWGGAALPAYGQVKLEWKFQEGETFYVETTVSEKQTVESKGKGQAGELTGTKLWRFTVRTAGAAPVLEQRLEKWQIKGKPPFGALPARVPEKLKGVVFTVALTPEGKITRFEGYAEVLKRLDAESEVMARLWRAVLSEETFRAEAERILGVWPAKAVAKGDVWEGTSTLPLAPFGAFRVEHRFTYRGQDKQGARIDDAATLTYVPPKGEVGGLPVKVVKGDFKSAGMKTSLVFDAARGRPVRAETKWEVRGNLTLEGDGNRAELRIEVSHTGTTRVLDKEP